MNIFKNPIFITILIIVGVILTLGIILYVRKKSKHSRLMSLNPNYKRLYDSGCRNIVKNTTIRSLVAWTEGTQPYICKSSKKEIKEDIKKLLVNVEDYGVTNRDASVYIYDYESMKGMTGVMPYSITDKVIAKGVEVIIKEVIRSASTTHPVYYSIGQQRFLLIRDVDRIV